MFTGDVRIARLSIILPAVIKGMLFKTFSKLHIVKDKLGGSFLCIASNVSV
jgi:hypothetical protein